MDIGINDIEIIIDKSVEFVTINDVITYKIIINNKSHIDIKDFFVKINIPKDSIYCEESLLLDAAYELCSEYNGLIVNDLKANSILEIVYDVKLISLPSDGQLINESFYSFKIGKQVFDCASNKVFVEIKSALIRKGEGFIRSISAGEFKVGKIIDFDILIKNTGNKTAYDLILNDILPSNIELVNKNVFVNNRILKLDNIKNVNLGELAPYKVLNVQYKALIKDVSNMEELFSISKLKYKNFDENKNEYTELESLSNELVIDIREAIIKDEEDFICKLNKNTSFVGEDITLNIKLKNTGNIKAENLKLNVYIPENLNIEDQVIEVSKEKQNILNLNSIKIEELTEGEEFDLEIKLRGNNIVSGEVKADLTYEYEDVFTREMVYKKSYSNVELINSYAAIVNDNSKIIFKEIDKKVATLEEEIEHTLFLENKGNIAAKNLVFKESEKGQMEYIPYSFKINDEETELKDFESVFLGDLNPGEHKKISYKTIVKNIPLDNVIKSKSYIEYEELIDTNIYLNKKLYCSENYIEIIAPKIEYKMNIEDSYVYKDKFISSNLILRNSGNINCERVSLNLNSSNNVNIKNISCNINGKIITDNLGGIVIESLKINEEIVIYFDLDIDRNINSSGDYYIDAILNYEYLLENKLLNKTFLLDKKYFDIAFDKLDFKIKSNIKAIENNEEFSLDLYIKNTGNINLQGININSCASEKIEVLYCSENLINGKIIIDSLLGNEYKTVKLILKCSDNVEADDLELRFLIEYEYYFAGNLYEKKQSEDLAIEIMNASTKMDLKIYEENIFVEDKFYNILKINNKGKYILKDCVLEFEGEDIELLEINGDILLDNKFIKVKNLMESIMIGNIDANKVIALNYTLSSKKVGEFNIKAKLTGIYEFDRVNEKREKIFYSNEIPIKIQEESVKIFVSTDKNTIYKDDDIKYRTVIINDGTIPLRLFYTMNVSKALDEEGNFLELNGVNVSKEECELRGFDLNSGEGAVIESNYFYNSLFGNDKVFAQVIIKYKSKKKNSPLIEVKSDKIINDVAISTFKELNIEHVENILEFEKEIMAISEVYIEPKITKHYIIDKFSFYKNNTKEKISLDKLFVKGRIDIKTEYISNDDMVYLHNNYVDFATFIFMPKIYGDVSKISIDVKVKDLYYKIVDMSDLLTNINLLIKIIF